MSYLCHGILMQKQKVGQKINYITNILNMSKKHANYLCEQCFSSIQLSTHIYTLY